MSTVACPICNKQVPSFFINSHLDSSCAVTESNSASSSSSAPRTAAPKTSSSPTETVFSSSKRKPQIASVPPKAEVPPAKRFKSSAAVLDAQPLAERVRPNTLEDFIGQETLLGKGTLLRGLIERDNLGSLILWGPPGTGKTTIARVIASTTKSVFKELSATSASTADLRKIFEEASNLLKLTGRKTILFIDEIQRFSKSQQDNFLPVLESGSISLIASTTENPSFRLNNALLSRCRVFVLSKLTPTEVLAVLKRALSLLSPTRPEGIDDDLLEFLASAADGDARVALGSLELALSTTKDGAIKVDKSELKAQLRKAHLQYDRSGDHHYDTISALHKSVRGGDADAALYWLARMLQGGDDPLYVARRMIRMASEDVGLANPQALPSAVAAYQATQLIGMPECDCILAQVVVMLAESPKSVRTYKAYGAAKSLVDSAENYPVPLHIRNAPTGLMKSLGYGRDYRYNPGFAHPVTQPFLPPELASTKFLEDEDSVKGKVYDEAALREWEWKENGGEKWEGREDMLRRLKEEEGCSQGS